MRVAAPPPKPLLIFDGDCNFCRRCVEYLRQLTGDQLEYLPFQDPQISQLFPEIPRRAFEESVQLIEPEGDVHRGAEAIFRAMAFEKRWPLWLYENLPGFAPISESSYQLVAQHRALFSAVTRWLWGDTFERSTYALARWLFIRLLGLTYLVAFVSLWAQIIGLAGHSGIMPVEQLMQRAREQTSTLGLDRFRLVPTLCWISASDASLSLQCGAGVALALLLIAGLAPVVSLVLLWLLYLSLVTVCPVFLAFQWDNLLLEVGLLAILFAPLTLRFGLRCEAPLSLLGLWLLRWLLFRLMFASGAVKLLSDDTTWWHLTALTFHYETQPLPTWIGWYAHQLPLWFQKISVLIMFAIELVVPFFVFLPRRMRLIAFWPIVALQIIIALTGNYGFFNLLALGLCVLLLDDKALLCFVPGRWRQLLLLRAGLSDGLKRAGEPRPWRRLRICHGTAAWIVAVLVLLISAMEMIGMFRVRAAWLQPVVGLYGWAAPFRSVNGYGLFAVMTTSRPEIIVQGSDDGQAWKEYDFKWKPGDVRRPPAFVEPHMPRLDWQMWFAALGTYRENSWFLNFCVRLLQGTPEVLALVQRNPFPDRPPKYIRAMVYDYHFTNLAQRRATGAWWRRESKGEYCPVLSLKPP